jgi:hypothetical protein
MARVEVITGPERRRRWSAEQKRAIVAESLAPGAVVTEIARRAEICPGQIYRWRPCHALGSQCRLQRGNIIGQRFGRRHEPDYPILSGPGLLSTTG